MEFSRHFAPQQSLGPNVRFGSKADIEEGATDVRFTPKSGHTRRFRPFEITVICAIGTTLVE
jgi:hypothetical protein